MASAVSTTQDELIIAIDFGATWSWFPGRANLTSEEVPSLIAYKGEEQLVKWGYEVKYQDSPLRCVKLLLCGQRDVSGWDNKPDLEASLSELGTCAVDVAADFMYKLHNCVLTGLEKQLIGLEEGLTSIRYIMTVPAVWDDAAKQATLEAAEDAGMDGVTLVSEPEAAAVAILSSGDIGTLKKDTVFIVCDMGGLTCDLITYQVKGLQPLRFHEVGPGTGGLCGSHLIDIGFEKLLKARLGASEIDRIQTMLPETWETIMANFENKVKRNYGTPAEDGFETCGHRIPVPGVRDDAATGIFLGHMTIFDEDLEQVFAPVAHDVIQLIEQQESKAISNGLPAQVLLLAGGMSQSDFMYAKIKDHFADRARDDYTPAECLKVFRLPDAETAIARGAVQLALTDVGPVTSRKARFHYGIEISVHFCEGVHDPADKYWCTVEECWRARGQMKWFVRRGDEVKSGVPVVIPLHRFKKTKESLQRPHTTILYKCADDVPKKRLRDANVHVLCSLEYDPTAAPSHSFEPFFNRNSREIWKHKFKLGMRVGSGELHFDYRVDDAVLSEVQGKFE